MKASATVRRLHIETQRLKPNPFPAIYGMPEGIP
jgi:hypothetical protein